MSSTVGANTLTFTASLGPGSHTATVTAINSLGQSVPSNVRTFTVAAPPSGVITVDRGAWNNQTTYAFDDHVTYSSRTWYVVAQTGVTGVTPGTDSTRWGSAVAA